MAKIRRGSSAISKIRLTFSALQGFLAVLALIHIVVLWRAKSEGRTDNNAAMDIPSKRNGEGPVVIPFVVSMTGCGEDPFMEGAAVLKYSIHLTSIHGDLGGRYDYKMYAFHHPNATQCAKSLEDLGYELIERDTPIRVEDIQGDYLRERIENNGCCGSKELIKLEAYTMTQYPIVVHLDLDFLLLKPIDILFDVMLDESGDLSRYRDSLDLMWPNTSLPTRVNAFFTRDVGMVKYGRKIFPVQGGFLVVRPDMGVYKELVELVKEGAFDEDKGWGGVVGKFYGSMTIQGLLPYYYDVLHPGEAVDLNRCVFDQMADNPRSPNRNDPTKRGKCNDGKEECEDCRERPFEDIISVHFTNCLKPWHCMAHHQEGLDHELCRKMHHEWFRVRSDLEKTWGRSPTSNGTWYTERFYGFCSRYGKKGYQPITRPFLSSFS